VAPVGGLGAAGIGRVGAGDLAERPAVRLLTRGGGLPRQGSAGRPGRKHAHQPPALSAVKSGSGNVTCSPNRAATQLPESPCPRGAFCRRSGQPPQSAHRPSGAFCRKSCGIL
jgi:hypothetical protein